MSIKISRNKEDSDLFDVLIDDHPLRVMDEEQMVAVLKRLGMMPAKLPVGDEIHEIKPYSERQ